MRKIVLALLVLLLAVPAMATVEVRCAQVSDTKQVIVTYDVTDGNEFRAFGIEISVDNGATISDIDPNDDDYYIHPGSIDVNGTNGEVDDYGSAVVDADVNSFILEMGSLYVGEANAPPSSGWLCKFWVDGDCNVSIDKDAARGGPVMADIEKTFASDYVDLVGCQLDWVPCFSESDPNFATWLAVGEPDAWCGSIYPRQCHGDADNRPQGKGNYWVSTWDLDVLVAAWNKSAEDIAGQTTIVGDPNLAVPWINADFDHAKQGKGNYRVSTWDLDIMVANWNKTNLPDPNCP